MEKVYIIKKVWISDGMPELDTEVYDTKELRDEAWNYLVHDHNNMIQEAFDIDLSDDSYNDDYHYEWDDHELEFYCRDDHSMHHDYFIKDVVVINKKEEN